MLIKGKTVREFFWRSLHVGSETPGVRCEITVVNTFKEILKVHAWFKESRIHLGSI